ncbi:MAG: 30S ribosomal protein S9 [Candidatus Methylacidiphilales bacterium]|nr:30S ribosomal protein S9 [Candidatus Methylacidiphilales bacterium]
MVTANVFSALGRRKTSVARVNIRPGSGKVSVNGKDLQDYFVTAAQRTMALLPLQATENLKKFDVHIRAQGGGLCGQAGAVSMALARALCQVDVGNRPGLKTKGLLTRDSRMKERKKSGQPGARKRFQFSKR